MRNPLFISVALILQIGNLAARPAPLQSHDPMLSAVGWAHADKDGSCTFFDAASRTLATWMKDLGHTGSLDISKLEATPEKWVLDPYGNAWIVSGPTLYRVDKNGKLGATLKLPGDVADLAWDTRGFILLYRGQETYLEKRDYNRGSLIWSAGKKPKGAEEGAPGAPLTQRMTISEDGNVLVASNGNLTLQSIDGAKGNPLGELRFNVAGGGAPRLVLDGKDRGALAWWLGHGVLFAAVPATQIPSEKKSGLLLARMDLGAGTVEFLPTGVSEDHKLLGILESEALLEKPGGGLVLVSVR